jgi:hypothetical protein
MIKGNAPRVTPLEMAVSGAVQLPLPWDVTYNIDPWEWQRDR